MANGTIEIQSVDNVKTMIHLLDKYKDELPADLVDSLKELADCKSCEFNSDTLISIGQNPDHVRCFIDGLEVKGVSSVNVILKRLTVYSSMWDGKEEAAVSEGGFVDTYKYPSNFVMKDKVGNDILGWNK